jgi:Tyrosine phosphatase family
MEVSSRRIASALFLCLVVSEDHVAHLERERERAVAASTASDAMGSDTVTNSDPPVYGGGLLFHCAQGKDRTGILSMLLSFCLYGDSPAVEERVVREYAASEELLRRGKGGRSGDELGDSQDSSVGILHSNGSGSGASNMETNSKTKTKGKSKESNGNLGEIQSLKGSPPQAICNTLVRVRSRYGGVLSYLDQIGFNREYRSRLQAASERSKSLTAAMLQDRDGYRDGEDRDRQDSVGQDRVE